MNDRQRNALLLVSLFVAANLLGLAAGMQYAQDPAVQEAAQQNTSPGAGLQVFLMIGLATVLMLALYRFGAARLVKYWMVTALFLTILLFVDAFIPAIPAVLLTLALLYLRFNAGMQVQNTVDVVAFAGAGALIGTILSPAAALALLFLLTIYDHFSVHISKHMITLAEEGVKSNTFMGFNYVKGGDAALPADAEHGSGTVEAQKVTNPQGQSIGVLGGGDVVIPMVVAVSFQSVFTPVTGLFIVLGAATALYVLLTQGQEGKFYPAIPTVAIGSMLGFLLWFVLAITL